MAETKWVPTYQYLGTLTDTVYLTAQVAREAGGGGLPLANRVSRRPETRAPFCAP